MKQELIPVGTIVNAHGIRGEVKLNPVGFDPAFLAEFDRFNIGGKETAVCSARVHKSVLLLTLPGVEDMDAALALKGKSVCIYAGDVELPEGEYFDVELEGCTVVPLAAQQKRLLVADGVEGLVFDPFTPVLDLTYTTKN